MDEESKHELGCLVNAIFTGCGAPWEHESSVAKLLVRELGGAASYCIPDTQFLDFARKSHLATEPEDLQEARRILRDIERLGIPFVSVTWQLQNEGIQKFIESYNALMQPLAVKYQEFLSAHIRAVSS
jgi:hypothetical protein